MAAQQKILRATDKQIVDAFRAISADIDVQAATLTFTLFAEGKPSNFTAELGQIDANESIQQLLDQNSVLFHTLSIHYPPLDHLSISIERAEPFDLLRISVRQPGQPPPEVQAAAVASVDRHLQAFKPAPIPDGVLGEDLANFYRSRDEAVLRLERLNADIIKQNEEYRQRLETDFNARKEQLENDFVERRTGLEHEISEQREALQAEKQELDDRSARHARREQFQQLKTVLQDRNKDFALTEGTVRKRRVLHILFSGLVAALGVLVAVLAYKQLWVGDPDPYFGLRLPVAVIGFVLALIYYIRWNDDWFLRHADEEFRLKKYDLDMDRAGWLVELAIEAYESGEEPIPDELLRRLSSNLFRSSEGAEGQREHSNHPSEDIRNALLDAAGEVEFNVPGIGKVILNRRQMRRFRRDIEKGRITVSEPTE